MEHTAQPEPFSADGPEHTLLALDKNVQQFPWESIPILRGRPVSRVPSLPVLLDIVAMSKLFQPDSKRHMVNTKKAFYILNSSGDLKNTQEAFEPLMKQMSEKAGWKGIVGRSPSELEMKQILRDNELVL
jgi:separase